VGALVFPNTQIFRVPSNTGMGGFCYPRQAHGGYVEPSVVLQRGILYAALQKQQGASCEPH
jgi:hypothetical protein